MPAVTLLCHDDTRRPYIIGLFSRSKARGRLAEHHRGAIAFCPAGQIGVVETPSALGCSGWPRERIVQLRR